MNGEIRDDEFQYPKRYTKAILDISDTFRYVNQEFGWRKIRWNYKLIEQVMTLCLKHRHEIEDGLPGFIRWNTISKELEWYIPERRKK